MRWYWIDRFTEFESGRRAKAIKNISLAEDHLHDHFPGYPVMPKSLVIEGLAQTGGLLVCEHSDFQEKVVLAKVSNAKFYSEAFPGDSLTYSTEVESLHKEGAIVSAVSHKAGELHAKMELVFALLNGEHENKELFAAGDLVKMMRILRAYEVGHDADGGPLVDPGD